VCIPRRRAELPGWVVGISVLALAAISACSDDAVAPPAAAVAGGADPYYPADGNPGYGVEGYAVTLTYDPSEATIAATTLVTARATRPESTFDLDLSSDLTVSGVTVNGTDADFAQVAQHELAIRPADRLTQGQPLQVVVHYHGQLADKGAAGAWYPIGLGGGVISGEPHSCAFWYPCNDVPTDKATFRLTATVPERFTVVSNGLEGATTSAGSGETATTTYRWHLDTPTATYLTMISVDRLIVERSRLSDGTPVVNAYSPGSLGERPSERRLPAILALLSAKFGPYPAPAAGGVFVDAGEGFSLETFTRPTYIPGVGVPTIVHENAHQWWGDNVSVKRWRDICFSECMASYAEWLWLEHEGRDLDTFYRRNLDQVDFHTPLYDMGPGHEFDFAGVYLKGSFFEHALRRKIGDDTSYFAALRGIQHDFAEGNMSMVELRNELARRTGVDLTSFWDEWVLHAERPSRANLFPGTLAH
jgi:aminopeptidase N